LNLNEPIWSFYPKNIRSRRIKGIIANHSLWSFDNK
jgi:hypothetical protein